MSTPKRKEQEQNAVPEEEELGKRRRDDDDAPDAEGAPDDGGRREAGDAAGAGTGGEGGGDPPAADDGDKGGKGSHKHVIDDDGEDEAAEGDRQAKKLKREDEGGAEDGAEQGGPPPMPQQGGQAASGDAQGQAGDAAAGGEYQQLQQYGMGYGQQAAQQGGGEEFTQGGHVVRLRGLPWDVNWTDIREFLAPLPVEEGNVLFARSFLGKPNGEAFVTFAAEEHQASALQYHHRHMGRRYIEVFQSTALDRDTQLRRQGASSTTDPMPNVMARSTTVRMRGLPFNATTNEVAEFFSGLSIMTNGVRIMMNNDGRPTGDAFVTFASPEHATMALQRHKQRMGHRYIELYQSDEVEIHRMAQRIAAAGGRGGGMGGMGGMGMGGMGGMGMGQAYGPGYGYQAAYAQQMQQYAQQYPQYAAAAAAATPGYFGAANTTGIAAAYKGPDASQYGGAAAAATGAAGSAAGPGAAAAATAGGATPGTAAGYDTGYDATNNNTVWGGAAAANYYAAAGQGQAQPQQQMYMDASAMGGAGQSPNGYPLDVTIRMRGLPFRTTSVESIAEFFTGYAYVHQSILVGQDKTGRISGEAWVSFNSAAEAQRAATERNNQYMGSRYVELFYPPTK